jgi:hypothetical protein
VLVGLGFGLSGCSRAVEEYCAARLPAGHEQVTAASVTYRVSQPYDAATLTGLREHPANETTMGLTSATSRAEVDVNLHGMSVPGGVCVRADIDVRLSYAPMNVYLARELVPGSCDYREILAHEMRHVGIFRDYIGGARQRVEATLRERLPAQRVYRFTSMDEAGKYFKDDQQNWIASAAQHELDGVARLQANIDTREEYLRLSRACAGNP